MRTRDCSSATQLHKPKTTLSVWHWDLKGYKFAHTHTPHTISLSALSVLLIWPLWCCEKPLAFLISVLQTPQAHITQTVPHSGCYSLLIKKKGKIPLITLLVFLNVYFADIHAFLSVMHVLCFTALCMSCEMSPSNRAPIRPKITTTSTALRTRTRVRM